MTASRLNRHLDEDVVIADVKVLDPLAERKVHLSGPELCKQMLSLLIDQRRRAYREHKVLAVGSDDVVNPLIGHWLRVRAGVSTGAVADNNLGKAVSVVGAEALSDLEDGHGTPRGLIAEQ